MERPIAVTELVTPFDMAGSVATELSTPFDMAGMIGTLLSTPFDMVEGLVTPQWGIPLGTTPVYLYLTTPASVGGTVLQVTSTAGLVPGQTLIIKGGTISFPPSGGTSVSSIVALKAALGDNSVSDIVVTNGTYLVDSANAGLTNSLLIDSTYAARTTPVVVRAATVGGVTFSRGGGGAQGIMFKGGAHHQTWDGFHFANMNVSSSGVIFFGGSLGVNAPHDIALKHITVDASCHRVNVGTATDHAVYFSYALDTWGNILIEDYTVVASDSMGLASGIHMDHGGPGDAPNVAAHGVTVRRMAFTGNTGIASQQAIILWTPPVHDWLFDGANIVNAGGSAVRFESIGASNIVFKDIVSVNSNGFYSSLGTYPSVPGVTFINDSFA